VAVSGAYSQRGTDARHDGLAPWNGPVGPRITPKFYYNPPEYLQVSSPVVAGDRIFFTTSHSTAGSALCLNGNTGECWA
jgi:hypothetical protein